MWCSDEKVKRKEAASTVVVSTQTSSAERRRQSDQTRQARRTNRRARTRCRAKHVHQIRSHVSSPRTTRSRAHNSSSQRRANLHHRKTEISVPGVHPVKIDFTPVLYTVGKAVVVGIFGVEVMCCARVIRQGALVEAIGWRSKGQKQSRDDPDGWSRRRLHSCT